MKGLARAATALALAAVVAAGDARAASLVVSPARLEVEVGPSGAARQLRLFNRGDDPVTLRLSTGLGTHRQDGTPVYFDHDEAVAESRRLMQLEKELVTVAPGDAEELEIGFVTVPGLVAAYPVIFVEFWEGERPDQPGAAPVLRSYPRLAVPVILTYSGTQRLRRPEISIQAVEARTVPGSTAVEVDIHVRNDGNVHDWVRGRVSLVGQDGSASVQAELPERRVLPGAERVLTVRLDSPEPDAVAAGALVAVVYGDGWQSGPILATYPRATEVAQAGGLDGAGDPQR